MRQDHVRLRLATLILATLAAAITTRASVFGQDSVKLKDGSRVVGDIVFEDANEVRLITSACEVKRIAASEIAESRRGTPLDGRVQKWLRELASPTAEAVFEVASRAAKEKALEVDARRLARRVVAELPDHAGARVLLGQVRALDRWFPDAASAKRAVAEAMKANGFVAYKDGWVKPADLQPLKLAPADWTLTPESIWRRTHDYRTERGDLFFNDGWYTKDQKPLIDRLELLDARAGIRASAAREGDIRVFYEGSQGAATRVAVRLEKVRKLFAKLYAAETRDLLGADFASIYIVRDDQKYGRFLDNCTELFPKEPPSDRARNVLWFRFAGVDQAIAQKYGPWENAVAYGLGQDMMRRLWRNDATVPVWLEEASGHIAEKSVSASSLVWHRFRGKNIPEAIDESEQSFKSVVLALAKIGLAPTLGDVVDSSDADFTFEREVTGAAFLAHLIDAYPKELIAYVRADPTLIGLERWKAAFGCDCSESDARFRKWLAK